MILTTSLSPSFFFFFKKKIIILARLNLFINRLSFLLSVSFVSFSCFLFLSLFSLPPNLSTTS